MAGEFNSLELITSVLEEAQRIGILGPAPISNHLEFARVMFEELIEPSLIKYVADLGSGAGVPSFYFLNFLPDAHFVLFERSKKRAAFLLRSLGVLRANKRCKVVNEDVEEVLKTPTFLNKFDLLTARLFARVDHTLRIGTYLLREEGCILTTVPTEWLNNCKISTSKERRMVENAGYEIISLKKVESGAFLYAKLKRNI